FIVGADSGGLDFGRRLEAVDGREILHDLHATPVAVHVAEAADVHENVEAKLLAGGKGTRQLVVASAMAQAKVDDFAAARLARTFNRSTKLPVGVMAVAVEERRGELNLKGIGIQQIDQQRGVNGGASHQFSGGLLQFAARLDFVEI